MTNPASAQELPIRYQPDERLPPALAIGLGAQLTALIVAVPVLVPTVVMRAAGTTEGYLLWAVFAAVVISGVTSALQGVRYGRIGSGHVLMMGSSAVFIWPCIVAIERGGPELLVTLVIVSALIQFVFSVRIEWSRRILTPTVSGTVLMLVTVTNMPVLFDILATVPHAAPAYGAPLCATVTVLVIVGIALKSERTLRLWAPVIGVVCGSIVAGIVGLYDVGLIIDAPWIGIPAVEWPGIDLEFGSAFWSLLPVFVLLTLIDSLRTVSVGAAVQRVSWRKQRSVDFRAVQGALNVESISKLLCGLGGTVPNNSFAICPSVIELSGVAARSVGIVAGLMCVILAFLPKVLAVVQAVPSQVVAGFLAVMLATLFVLGFRVLLQDGLDYRNGLIAGIAFWVGIGVQNDMLLPAHVSDFAGGLFANGVVSGGLTAIVMTLFVQLTEPRPSRMEAELDLAALSRIREFLRTFATRSGWDAEMAARLDAVGEEALLTLISSEESESNPDQRRYLRLIAARSKHGAVLEFAVAPRDGNIQDRLALLGDPDEETSMEHDVSLRLLRHLASSVRHQQYHDVDIVTVQVQAPLAVK